MTVPPETVVPPLWLLVPDRVSVPLPSLVSDAPPEPLMLPLNSVDVLLPPAFRVPTSAMDPAPAMEPTASVPDTDSVAPLATVTADVSAMALLPLTASVPAETVVAPV